jgi:hypothetical protein
VLPDKWKIHGCGQKNGESGVVVAWKFISSVFPKENNFLMSIYFLPLPLPILLLLYMHLYL